MKMTQVYQVWSLNVSASQTLRCQRSMRQFDTIMAYLTPSPFRIKVDRIFSGSNSTLTGNTVSCHVEFIECDNHLRDKRFFVSFLLSKPVHAVIIFYYVSRIICGNTPNARSISYKC